MEKIFCETPVEVFEQEGWTTIRLNENDLERLKGNHPFAFKMGKAQYLLTRIEGEG
jgi:hypothetical protein|tara:strand:+ start:29 stop:196 length:168 start_codon:yes stop_codon:yes gene_type:complete